MEASALKHASRGGLLARRSTLLRLQSDERLIAMIRAGHDRAFEVLFDRYHARLLAFSRHMLRSSEDAEDVLQEVFTNAHAAILGDEREINVRPWLYRIARNRCLNHLRKPVPEGQDSMDIHPHEGGTTTADRVQCREDFRALVADVQDLPETQRTALLLRELDALSYDEIAESMDTTVSAVKSLLVRARMSLAEATQSRVLTCGDVQLELAEAAEGLAKVTGPARHHVRRCETCKAFRAKLRSNGRELSGLAPAALLVWLHKAFGTGLFGFGQSAAAGGSAAAGTGVGAAAATGSGAAAAGGAAGAGAAACSGAAAGASAAAAAGSAAGGIGGIIGSKAVAGLATAALVTAGAVEVRHLYKKDRAPGPGDVPAAVQGAPSPQGAAPIAALTTSGGEQAGDEDAAADADEGRSQQPGEDAEKLDATAAEAASPDEEATESSSETVDEDAEKAAEEKAGREKKESSDRRARGSQAVATPLPAPDPCGSTADDDAPADSHDAGAGTEQAATPEDEACAERSASPE